jgi:hypothetical protein
LPEWLPQVVLGTVAGAALMGLMTWFFPARHEAAEPAPRRAARAAAAVALVLGVIMSADHIWPHSWAATLLAAVAAIVIFAAVRGILSSPKRARGR